MLCLTIHESECFTIGDNIKIKIIKSGERKNLVGILAPQTLSIKRVVLKANKKNIIKERKDQDESATDGDFFKNKSKEIEYLTDDQKHNFLKESLDRFEKEKLNK